MPCNSICCIMPHHDVVLDHKQALTEDVLQPLPDSILIVLGDIQDVAIVHSLNTTCQKTLPV